MTLSKFLRISQKKLEAAQKAKAKAKLSKTQSSTAQNPSFGSRAQPDAQPLDLVAVVPTDKMEEYSIRDSKSPAPPVQSTPQSNRGVQGNLPSQVQAMNTHDNKILTMGNDWIEVFEGKKSDDAEEWIRSFQWIAESCKWDSKFKIIQFRRLMKGTARNWFESLANEIREDPEELLKEFKTVFKMEKTYPYFVEVKQEENEEIENYLYRTLSICKRINVQMSNSEKMNYFIKGLEPRIRISVLSKKVGTLEEAVEIAKKKQHSLKISKMVEENESTRPKKKVKTEENVIKVNQVSGVDDRRPFKNVPYRKRFEGYSDQSLEPHYQNSRMYYRDSEMHDRNSERHQNQSSDRHQNPEWSYQNQGSHYQNSRPCYQNSGPRYQNQSWQRYEKDDWRTMGGKPICRSCRRVGHTWKSCTEKNLIPITAKRMEPGTSQEKKEPPVQSKVNGI